MTPVVLDTGVLVAGIYWSNEPCRCVNAWLRGMIRLIVSPGIYAEYERVLRRVKAEQDFTTDLVPWLTALRTKALWVTPRAWLATLPRETRRRLG